MSATKSITLNTGASIPKIGLGTALSMEDSMRKALKVALECGYRLIDTAFYYDNESFIGDELQEWFMNGKLKRNEVFVTSKLPFYGSRSKDVPRFLKMSLEKLKLDYLDLYLIHHPVGLRCLSSSDICFYNDPNKDVVADYETNLEELWGAMEDQVTAGRAKAIGVSNFNEEQLDRIMKIAKIPPAVNQVELHCYLQQPALIKKCKDLGIAVEAYSPVGAPHLWEPSETSPVLLEHPKVLEIAKRHGKTSAQIALNFLMSQDIIILPKSVTPERIKTNFEVSDFVLSQEELDSLKSLDMGEKGRVFHFKDLIPGCEKHKEYPFTQRLKMSGETI